MTKRSMFMIFASIALTFLMVLLLVITPWAYTVQSGDTLSKIAAKYGTTADAIAALNGIENKNMIYVGQELTIPGSSDGYERTSISKKEEKALEKIFDASFYAGEYPDVVAALGTDPVKLFEHYLNNGIWETRQPNKDFNVNAYASAYSDLRNAFGNEPRARQLLDYTLHYSNYGIAENRELTTIEDCQKNNIEVLYYGSYDNGDANKAYEAPVFKKTAASAAPVATGNYVKDLLWQDVWNILEQTSSFLKEHSTVANTPGNDVYDFVYGKPSEKNDITTLDWFFNSMFWSNPEFSPEDDIAYGYLYDSLLDDLCSKYLFNATDYTDFNEAAKIYQNYYIEYDKFTSGLREDEPEYPIAEELLPPVIGYCAGFFYSSYIEAFDIFWFDSENNYEWRMPAF